MGLHCTNFPTVTYKASNITFRYSKNSDNHEDDTATHHVAICSVVVEQSVKNGPGHLKLVLALQHPATSNSKFFH